VLIVELAGYEKALGPDHGRTRRLAQTLDEAAKEYSKCQVSNVTDDSLKAALDKSVVRDATTSSHIRS
jgi:hypothetical protein